MGSNGVRSAKPSGHARSAGDLAASRCGLRKHVHKLLAVPAWALAVEAAAAALPPALCAPDQRVVCNRGEGVCFDRYGPSVGLTRAFLGRPAAERLLSRLHDHPADHRAGAVFAPAAGIECLRETGPCRVDGRPHAPLTRALYGPWPPRAVSAGVAAIASGEWQWLGTRYADGSESRPAEPARYRLRLAPDGSMRIRSDCNEAGGRYRLEDGRIAVEVAHSTLATCAPDSLDTVFRRDLAAATAYFLRAGRLYLELGSDAGTMEFGRG